MNPLKRKILNYFIIISLVIVSGCKTYRYEADLMNVKSDAMMRLSAADDMDFLTSHPNDNNEVNSIIGKILENELTLNSAIQLTVLNNPELQASFEKLGIQKAELMQAAILPNPNVHIDRMESHSGRFLPHARQYAQIHWSVSIDLLDLLSKPNLAKISRAQVEIAKMRLTNQLLDKINDVSKAVHNFLYEKKHLNLLEEIFEGSEAKLELAIEQHKAGNISDLDLVEQEMEYQNDKLNVNGQQYKTLVAREKLNRLMGLWGTMTEWVMHSEFPRVKEINLTRSELITSAIERNLEIAAASYEINVYKRQHSMNKAMIIPSFEFGVSREKEDGHDPTSGRSVAFELPIFDHNQSETNRLSAMIQKQEKEIRAISINLRSQLKLLHALYTGLRKKLTYYENAVLPIRKKYLSLSERHYNGMFIGPYELLDVKRSELEAQQDYDRILRDYLNAASDLNHALAGGYAGGSGMFTGDVKTSNVRREKDSGH